MERHVVVAEGDGVGPEIMEATLSIIRAAKTPITWDSLVLGQAVYEKGNSSGIPADAWDLIRKHGVLLKGPITTP